MGDTDPSPPALPWNIYTGGKAASLGVKLLVPDEQEPGDVPKSAHQALKEMIYHGAT
jgi:hypothetical protein